MFTDYDLFTWECQAEKLRTSIFIGGDNRAEVDAGLNTVLFPRIVIPGAATTNLKTPGVPQRRDLPVRFKVTPKDFVNLFEKNLLAVVGTEIVLHGIGDTPEADVEMTLEPDPYREFPVGPTVMFSELSPGEPLPPLWPEEQPSNTPEMLDYWLAEVLHMTYSTIMAGVGRKQWGTVAELAVGGRTATHEREGHYYLVFNPWRWQPSSFPNGAVQIDPDLLGREKVIVPKLPASLDVGEITQAVSNSRGEVIRAIGGLDRRLQGIEKLLASSSRNRPRR